MAEVLAPTCSRTSSRSCVESTTPELLSETHVGRTSAGLACQVRGPAEARERPFFFFQDERRPFQDAHSSLDRARLCPNSFLCFSPKSGRRPRHLVRDTPTPEGSHQASSFTAPRMLYLILYPPFNSTLDYLLFSTSNMTCDSGPLRIPPPVRWENGEDGANGHPGVYPGVSPLYDVSCLFFTFLIPWSKLD